MASSITEEVSNRRKKDKEGKDALVGKGSPEVAEALEIVETVELIRNKTSGTIEKSRKKLIDDLNKKTITNVADSLLDE